MRSRHVRIYPRLICFYEVESFLSAFPVFLPARNRYALHNRRVYLRVNAARCVWLAGITTRKDQGGHVSVGSPVRVGVVYNIPNYVRKRGVIRGLQKIYR